MAQLDAGGVCCTTVREVLKLLCSLGMCLVLPAPLGARRCGQGAQLDTTGMAMLGSVPELGQHGQGRGSCAMACAVTALLSPQVVRGKDRGSKKREDMLSQLRPGSQHTESLSLMEFIRRK